MVTTLEKNMEKNTSWRKWLRNICYSKPRPEKAECQGFSLEGFKILG